MSDKIGVASPFHSVEHYKCSALFLPRCELWRDLNFVWHSPVNRSDRLCDVPATKSHSFMSSPDHRIDVSSRRGPVRDD